jgi:hypothetical protein
MIFLKSKMSDMNKCEYKKKTELEAVIRGINNT